MSYFQSQLRIHMVINAKLLGHLLRKEWSLRRLALTSEKYPNRKLSSICWGFQCKCLMVCHQIGCFRTELQTYIGIQSDSNEFLLQISLYRNIQMSKEICFLHFLTFYLRILHRSLPLPCQLARCLKLLLIML